MLPTRAADFVDSLVSEHYQLAARSARRLFSRPDRRDWLDEAETVATHALLRAARRYRAEYGPFIPWAVREIGEKLRRLLARRIRQREREPRVERLRDDPEGRPVVQRDSLAASRLEYVVRTADLTDCQREAVRMRFVRGMSFGEIAAARGIKRPAAYRLVGRGVANIRARWVGNASARGAG